jgi:hypothetical protein
MSKWIETGMALIIIIMLFVMNNFYHEMDIIHKGISNNRQKIDEIYDYLSSVYGDALPDEN